MSGPLNRNRLRELFDALSTELREQGHRAHIYIVGGAAMALCFDSRRSTHDVDARISSGHGPVTQAARRIARREGLPESWLNEQATIYMPSTPDTHAPTVYDSPSLVVTGASAEHVLAMKLESGRAEDQDDIRTLVRHLKLTECAEAEAIHRSTFPQGRIRRLAREALREAVNETMD